MSGVRFTDLTGQRFGKWVVSRLSHRSPNGERYWLFICNCGTQSPVRGHQLKAGKSCGCLHCNDAKVTHGLTRVGKKWTPEYTCWTSMNQRCNDPGHKAFADYGGRGILICSRWRGRDGFLNFLADMGERPEGMSLERKDNNKGYSPDNCRWATRHDQIRNRRNTRLITVAGRTQCSKDWAREMGVEYRALHYFLKLGWTIKKLKSGFAVVQ